METFLRKLVCITLALLLLSSCNPKNTLPEDEFPEIGIPIEEINSRFRIIITKDMENSFKNQEPLNFIVEIINSDKSIVFDTYSYVRIFSREGENWIEYPYEYHGNENRNSSNHSWKFNLDAQQPNFKDRSYQFIFPDIPDLEEPTWFRIFLIGFLHEDEVVFDQKTAASVDMLLKP